jgi:hypothetical protein
VTFIKPFKGAQAIKVLGTSGLIIQRFMSCLFKIKREFYHSAVHHVRIFDFCKNSLIQNCSSF